MSGVGVSKTTLWSRDHGSPLLIRRRGRRSMEPNIEWLAADAHVADRLQQPRAAVGGDSERSRHERAAPAGSVCGAATACRGEGRCNAEGTWPQLTAAAASQTSPGSCRREALDAPTASSGRLATSPSRLTWTRPQSRLRGPGGVPQPRRDGLAVGRVGRRAARFITVSATALVARLGARVSPLLSEAHLRSPRRQERA